MSGGTAQVEASTWREVEVGRVVIFANGPNQGQLAAIVEIVDHKRILVENPTPSSANKDLPAVPRQCVSLADVTLTHITIPKTPRALGSGPLRKRWTENEIDKKWSGSTWAQNRARSDRRKQLNDFERFKVMRLRKQARFDERKAIAKVRAGAAKA